MIARFEGGPYHGLTVEVHGRYVDFRAMGLRAMGLAPVADVRSHSHELVAGQYVTKGKQEAEILEFEWDGPEVEAPTLLLNTESAKPDADDSRSSVEHRLGARDRRHAVSTGRRNTGRNRRHGDRRSAVGHRRAQTQRRRVV